MKFAIICSLLMLSLADARAQERGSAFPRMSPNASVGQTIGLTEVKINYGRPSVKGRNVFGDLEPLGKVWRTGANEATTISFSTPVEVEGRRLEAGTYGLFTIPGLKEWTVIFNDVSRQWGAFSYDSTKDVLRVAAKPILDDHQEQLQMTFEAVSHQGATLLLRWHRIRVPVSITVNTDSIFRARAAAELTNSTDPKKFFNYAFSAHTNDLLNTEAIGWAKQAIQLKESYDNVAVHARLLGQGGHYAEAIAEAEHALRLDQTGKFEPSVLAKLPDLITEWKKQLQR